eukprot:CAMPEP_0115056154 /NCGR_PEP_ID=MMETSP0227-20121206/5035_1 /TAXON_ID=89957 /ORGANISM="Polarella glacialis, Strain CCMP 1383" /LENGTH=91 /DNA_ID=CAMNT_0002440795 /DNA_START=48 /DNA_END=324 /DNA_ORIENTATION=-
MTIGAQGSEAQAAAWLGRLTRKAAWMKAKPKLGQPPQPVGPPPKRAWPGSGRAEAPSQQAKRPRTGEVCRWFLKGQCWSGNSCKMSHAQYV